MKFLEKSLDQILEAHQNLENVHIVLPGKRPVIFLKRIITHKKYEGFLPKFLTVEELFTSISGTTEINGIALWLYAYEVYKKLYPAETLSQFLKWFPTLLKDWDDMLKFYGDDAPILQYMLDEERIKNWGETLSDDNTAFKKNLNFWKKVNHFLPQLRKELVHQQLATAGMISVEVREKINNFAENTPNHFYFLGFNAFTPAEEYAVKKLLSNSKAECFFQADSYYFEDEKQEAGKFLRKNSAWKEFSREKPFRWIEDDFRLSKNITVYEVPGNITQAKVLPEILQNRKDFSDTAIILLDENLLPATLDSLSSVGNLNITMGFPLKNLQFANLVKHIFYLQKQLHKKDTSYYYQDLQSILEEIPKTPLQEKIIADFIKKLREKNIVYISKKLVEEVLQDLSFYNLLKKQDAKELLQLFLEFCEELKLHAEDDDILFESITHFQKSFRTVKNQLELYDFQIDMETLEVLVQQFINAETLDFIGEPLQGLQVMGLLETRLLNFKNVILLSVNEGKLPLGNSQNTYLPFDVRKQFEMNTFLENDSIYAYHFYRLLQESENVHLLFNSLSSGVNTGEKSRFIVQLEMETAHEIKNIVVENDAEALETTEIVIPKTAPVQEKLQLWKKRVAVSHLTSYLYSPFDFYTSKILGIYETDEVEEELSSRNYGNLVHFALQVLYEKIKNKILTVNDIENLINAKEEALDQAVKKLNHLQEYYEKGMNYIHKSVASKVIDDLLQVDLELVKQGNSLEIVDLERKFEDVEFFLNEERSDSVLLYGYIDRIDRLNGKLRIIDYKTAKTDGLKVKINSTNVENYFRKNDRKQAMQLCLYQYVVQQMSEFAAENIETGIWSFAEAKRGVVPLVYVEGSLDEAMISVRNLILEILNPNYTFSETLQELEYSEI